MATQENKVTLVGHTQAAAGTGNEIAEKIKAALNAEAARVFDGELPPGFDMFDNEPTPADRLEFISFIAGVKAVNYRVTVEQLD